MNFILTGRALLLYSAIVSLGVVTSATNASGQEIIQVEGRGVEILRGGKGAPTVVFEAGLGSDVNQLKQFVLMVGTGAISYSRAGEGKSESVTGPRTPEKIAAELHRLLETAGYTPPYILVGQSAGALYARAFTIAHPTEVAGLVLVDGTPDRWEFVQKKSADSRNEPYRWPPEADPHWSAITKAEFSGLLPIVTSDKNDPMGKMPDVPTAIITSLNPAGIKNGREIKALSRRLHSEEFQSTTYGMHIVTSKSGHAIPRDEPYLILGAIRWIIEAARTQALGVPNACSVSG